MRCIYFKDKDVCSDEVEILEFDGCKIPVCTKHSGKFWKIKYEIEVAKKLAYEELVRYAENY